MVRKRLAKDIPIGNEKCNPISGHLNTIELDGVRYPQYVPSYFNTSLNFDCLNKSSAIKKILFWNTFWGNLGFQYGLGVVTPFVKHNCPVSNCELLIDKTRISEADLVIVHMLDEFSPIPQQRPPHQRWVYIYK
jgi:hypothetical protein